MTEKKGDSVARKPHEGVFTGGGERAHRHRGERYLFLLEGGGCDGGTGGSQLLTIRAVGVSTSRLQSSRAVEAESLGAG